MRKAQLTMQQRAERAREMEQTDKALDSGVLLGADRIRIERERQISGEGWTPAHDDEHTLGVMLNAAACYVAQAQSQIVEHEHGWPTKPNEEMLSLWPWEQEWWKPDNDPVRNLEKAGALIAAEIDRIERQRNPGS